MNVQCHHSHRNRCNKSNLRRIFRFSLDIRQLVYDFQFLGHILALETETTQDIRSVNYLSRASRSKKLKLLDFRESFPESILKIRITFSGFVPI